MIFSSKNNIFDGKNFIPEWQLDSGEIIGCLDELYDRVFDTADEMTAREIIYPAMVYI